MVNVDREQIKTMQTAETEPLRAVAGYRTADNRPTRTGIYDGEEQWQTHRLTYTKCPKSRFTESIIL
jgi:hypothetical protein